MFRLTINPAVEIGNNLIEMTFKTEEDAIRTSEYVANFILFLQEIKAMPDYSNFFIIEKYIDGEWVETEEI